MVNYHRHPPQQTSRLIHRSTMPFSWQRTVASTGLVLVTTLDDAVWLVPFVAGQRHAQIATTHAALFVATLEGMAITVCCVTALVQHQVLGTFNESQLTLVGLVLWWLLAVFLFYKKWQKRRRRRQQQQQQQQGNPTNNQAVKTENNPLLPVSAEREVQEHEVRETAQPWMVCSLTLLVSTCVSLSLSMFWGCRICPTHAFFDSLLHLHSFITTTRDLWTKWPTFLPSCSPASFRHWNSVSVRFWRPWSCSAWCCTPCGPANLSCSVWIVFHSMPW